MHFQNQPCRQAHVVCIPSHYILQSATSNCMHLETGLGSHAADQIFGKAGIFTAGGLSSGPFNSAIVDQGDSALRDSLDLLRRSADSLRQSIGPLSQVRHSITATIQIDSNTLQPCKMSSLLL